MNKKKNCIEDKQQVTTYKIFYGLTIVLIMYLGLSLVSSYQDFAAYCEAYKVSMASQWFLGLKTILAATIPCMVYASLTYGLGYVIKKIDIYND